MTPSLYRLSAFTRDPAGGNPAGVWLGPALPDAPTMQRIAAEVGYSETVFIAPLQGAQREVRYYSPLDEVDFCGHATIAAAVQLGRLHGDGEYVFHTVVGAVPVRVSGGDAALTSVPPQQRALAADDLADLLGVFGWRAEEVDPAIAPGLAYAGSWHAVIALRQRASLDALNYDFARLQALSARIGFTTAQLVWREHAGRFHARNPFPAGGVIEDPATGSAAAALGGYLRERGLLVAPARFEIVQGVVMGRPSRLLVEVPESGGITVSGSAVSLDD